LFTHLISLTSIHCNLLRRFLFFFNDTPTTEIYTLSLHDALPILPVDRLARLDVGGRHRTAATDPLEQLFDERRVLAERAALEERSEEHTSELQSRGHLVCRLLLEKKKKYLGKS